MSQERAGASAGVPYIGPEKKEVTEKTTTEQKETVDKKKSKE